MWQKDRVEMLNLIFKTSEILGIQNLNKIVTRKCIRIANMVITVDLIRILIKK
jgi:hypothetical protein